MIFTLLCSKPQTRKFNSMEQHTDNLGLAYSANTATSIESFNQCIEYYLANLACVMPSLDELIKNDNKMPMAHCLRAYLLKLSGDPKFSPAFNQELNFLTAMSPKLNEREQQHLHALLAWSKNLMAEASQILETLLQHHPKDMIALRITHYLHFYAGNAQSMRDTAARAVEIWQQDDLFYGYLLGMYSFGLEESGDYEKAEKMGRKAMQINPRDLWACHAVTHILEMQKRPVEGIIWLESYMLDWRDNNNFVFHLYWHKALFHVEMGEYVSALAIYDDFLAAPLDDDFYLDICNATSLLWRLEVKGMDVGDRWSNLLSFAERRVEDDELVFSTLHYLMIPARLQNTSLMKKALAHFESWSQTGTTQGEVCAAVGLSLAQSLVALGEYDYAETDRSSGRFR